MTTIIIPGEHLLVPALNIIPEIEGNLGRSWNQPKRNHISIEIKDTSNEIGTSLSVPPKYDLIHAYMSQAHMQQLSNYSRSQPTGVYPGKMWRGQYTDLAGLERWYLCWYDEVKGRPDMCCTKSVPILLTDILDLINPPQG